MPIETLSRGAKLSYEQYFAQDIGVDKILFPTEDNDISAAVALDRFIQAPYALIYPDVSGNPQMRQYESGTASNYPVPEAVTVTRIGQELRDVVVHGMEATDNQAMHIRKIMDDIVKDHVAAHRVTRWKQALDVIFDGVFYARGPGGVNLGRGIDFERDRGNKFAHSFGSNLSVTEALTQMQKKLKSQGTPQKKMIVIMGEKYLARFFSDPSVQKYLTSNEANYLLRQEMQPPSLVNQDSGLVVNAAFRAPEMSAPLYICSYDPGVNYVTTKGAAATPWIADNKAAMLSLNSPCYNIQRGVDVLNERGEIIRTVGEIVFDSYVENSPLGEYIRSQTRHAYIPANINHVAISTGTFPSGG